MIFFSVIRYTYLASAAVLLLPPVDHSINTSDACCRWAGYTYTLYVYKHTRLWCYRQRQSAVMTRALPETFVGKIN